MVKKEKIRSKDAGLELGLLIAQYFFDTDHLHYGIWPKGLEVKPIHIKKAQEYHSKLILESIPKGVKTVLDVGGGSGGLAQKLIEQGYDVDCVSPSDYLADEIEQKLDGKVFVYRGKFEDVIIDKKYDIILFSESFQYMRIRDALKKVQSVSNANGYMFIFDYFTLEGPGKSPIGGGHKWETSQKILSEFPFEIILNKDMTKEAAPTQALLGQFADQVADPGRKILGDYLTSQYPKVMSFLKWKLAKRILKIEKEYFSGIQTAETFMKHKTYRLLLYKIS
ncbi:MAG: methyltransferase domain-containing protein [Candidatus Marinimicrobia bacterium]|nr:methyltransferase domain-containing protein [Candidatus Neomarinimicrobiota bacterium]